MAVVGDCDKCEARLVKTGIRIRLLREALSKISLVGCGLSNLSWMGIASEALWNDDEIWATPSAKYVESPRVESGDE